MNFQLAQKLDRYEITYINELLKDKLITLRFHCQRNPEHSLLILIFNIVNNTLTVPGQNKIRLRTN